MPTNKKTGDWGELVAAQYLAEQGYAIAEQQWRRENFEIDIIARKGTRIIFVEVKMRAPGTTDPVDAVNNRKRQRMIQGADFYLKYKRLPLDYQFDIIAITGTKDNYKLVHIPDAFLPSPRSGGNVFRRKY